MQDYAWAQNKAKLQRALGALGPTATEEAVKARYIEMAGFVLNDAGENAPEPIIGDEPKKRKKSKD